MYTNQISATTKRYFIWSGPASMAILLFALVVLIGFVPPPRPTWSAEQIAEIYATNQTSILIGAFLFTTFSVLWANWVAVVIAQCKRVEGSSSFLTFALVIFGTSMFLITMLCGLTVGVGAYRPGDVSPEITRLVNDVFWFLMEYSWPPFAALMIVIAIAIFSDKKGVTGFPRWVGYLNLWVALLMVPGGLMGFFKSGVFAYDGLMPFYVLALAYIAWVIAMCPVMLKTVAREERQESLVGAEEGTR